MRKLTMASYTRRIVHYGFLLFHFVSFRADALWLGDCNKPLGISTGKIPDKAMSASSSHDLIVGPHRARLGRDEGGGAWCPRGMVDKNQMEYIEVDLGEPPKLVTGVGTQGRFANNFGVEYTPAFTVEFMRPRATLFQPMTSPPGSNETLLFAGNTDTFTEIRNEFDLPILASRVRIRPISVYPRVVCLRFELYGCNYTGSLDHYEIEGRNDIFAVGEGVLYDGTVTTSLCLEEEVLNKYPEVEESEDLHSNRTPKVKRSLLVPQTSGVQTRGSSRLNLTKEEDERRSTKSSESFSDRSRLISPYIREVTTKEKAHQAPATENETLQSDVRTNSSNFIADDRSKDEPLVLPVIPPGEIVAPELPLNVTFVFSDIQNFSRIFMYVDPIHPLVAGAHPELIVSLGFGLDTITWMEPLRTHTFTLESEALNVTIDTDDRPALILRLYLAIHNAEVNIQEFYFESSNCDCIVNTKMAEIHKGAVRTIKALGSDKATKSIHSKSTTNGKNFNFSSDEFVKAKTTPDTLPETTREEIKILGGALHKDFGTKASNVETKVTTVWAVHTATTHRTYVGVAIGFSVGVALLLCVWMYLWVKFNRSKVTSPRMFRRSPLPDTLDMACLMDGNLTDFGIAIENPDDGNEDHHTYSSSSRISSSNLGVSKPGGLIKLQDDLSNVLLSSSVSSSSFSSLDTRSKNSHLSHQYFGNEIYSDFTTERQKKVNYTSNHSSLYKKKKTKNSIFGLQAVVNKTPPELVHSQSESRYQVGTHQENISFISSPDGSANSFSSWDKNLKPMSYSPQNGKICHKNSLRRNF